MKLQSLISFLLKENSGGLYEDVFEIADYPEGFSLEQLKDQHSFAAKSRYLKLHGLDKLGAGSSRAAFVADNDTVIKIAKNKKGLAQNRVEVNLSSDDLMPTDAPIALVKDSDPDYFWVEAERATKASPGHFKAITGFTMKDTMKALQELVDELRDQTIPGSWRYLEDRKLYKKIAKSSFLINLAEVVVNHDLSMGDLQRISSWGVVNRNGSPHLVLIDYGLDKDVYQQHYAWR